MARAIYWTPRIASLLFSAYLALFALDVFNEHQGLAVVPALLMHLLPAFAMLAVAAVAWKYELLGAAFFALAAAGYVWMAGLQRPWSWYVGISGPALVVAALYLVAWLHKRKHKQAIKSVAA